MLSAKRLVNMPTRARRFTSQASVGMFASRIPSSQLSKNDSFSTVKKRPVLHYTCAGRAICASFAPLAVYIYGERGESCTTRLALLRSARQGPDRDRAWHPRVLGQGDAYSSLASGKSLTPPARCIHRPQRDTSSLEYQLLVSRASAGASREPSSRRSPALTPRTRRLDPTFRYGAFFFVAFALADVPSARLTVGDSNCNSRIKFSGIV